MPARKKEYYVTVDVGGTSVKAALINSEGDVLVDSFSIVPIDSNGPSEQVIGTITSVIEGLFHKASEGGEVKGIGLCFPEFSDFKNGTIAVIKDKFRTSSGINLRDEIITKLKLPSDFLVMFEEDSIAFLKGAGHVEKVKAYNRIIGLTLGTGLGSAFMNGGEIIRNAPGIPPDGELGCLPYKAGIIEDTISNRGLTGIYRKRSGILEKDIKRLALGAKEGDSQAIRTFEEFGKTAGQILRPYIDNFKAECVIIGGQIAKSFTLFAESFKRELSSISSLKEIIRAESIDYSPLYGLYNIIKAEFIR